MHDNKIDNIEFFGKFYNSFEADIEPLIIDEKSQNIFDKVQEVIELLMNLPEHAKYFNPSGEEITLEQFKTSFSELIILASTSIKDINAINKFNATNQSYEITAQDKINLQDNIKCFNEAYHDIKNSIVVQTNDISAKEIQGNKVDDTYFFGQVYNIFEKDIGHLISDEKSQNILNKVQKVVELLMNLPLYTRFFDPSGNEVTVKQLRTSFSELIILASQYIKDSHVIHATREINPQYKISQKDEANLRYKINSFNNFYYKMLSFSIIKNDIQIDLYNEQKFNDISIKDKFKIDNKSACVHELIDQFDSEYMRDSKASKKIVHYKDEEGETQKVKIITVEKDSFQSHTSYIPYVINLTTLIHGANEFLYYSSREGQECNDFIDLNHINNLQVRLDNSKIKILRSFFYKHFDEFKKIGVADGKKVDFHNPKPETYLLNKLDKFINSDNNSEHNKIASKLYAKLIKKLNKKYNEIYNDFVEYELNDAYKVYCDRETSIGESPISFSEFLKQIDVFRNTISMTHATDKVVYSKKLKNIDQTEEDQYLTTVVEPITPKIEKEEDKERLFKRNEKLKNTSFIDKKLEIFKSNVIEGKVMMSSSCLGYDSLKNCYNQSDYITTKSQIEKFDKNIGIIQETSSIAEQDQDQDQEQDQQNEMNYSIEQFKQDNAENKTLSMIRGGSPAIAKNATAKDMENPRTNLLESIAAATPELIEGHKTHKKPVLLLGLTSGPSNDKQKKLLIPKKIGNGTDGNMNSHISKTVDKYNKNPNKKNPIYVQVAPVNPSKYLNQQFNNKLDNQLTTGETEKISLGQSLLHLIENIEDKNKVLIQYQVNDILVDAVKYYIKLEKSYKNVSFSNKEVDFIDTLNYIEQLIDLQIKFNEQNKDYFQREKSSAEDREDIEKIEEMKKNIKECDEITKSLNIIKSNIPIVSPYCKSRKDRTGGIESIAKSRAVYRKSQMLEIGREINNLQDGGLKISGITQPGTINKLKSLNPQNIEKHIHKSWQKNIAFNSSTNYLSGQGGANYGCYGTKKNNSKNFGSYMKNANSSFYSIISPHAALNKLGKFKVLAQDTLKTMGVNLGLWKNKKTNKHQDHEMTKNTSSNYIQNVQNPEKKSYKLNLSGKKNKSTGKEARFYNSSEPPKTNYRENSYPSLFRY